MPQPARASTRAVASAGWHGWVNVEGLQTNAGRRVDNSTIAERAVETDLHERRHRRELLGCLVPVRVHAPDGALEEFDFDRITPLAEDHFGEAVVRAERRPGLDVSDPERRIGRFNGLVVRRCDCSTFPLQPAVLAYDLLVVSVTGPLVLHDHDLPFPQCSPRLALA